MNKIDILNRDKFVDDLLQVMENISDNKASTCFSLNGAWGSGKSFVLDMFEEKLGQIQSEETSTDKYFIRFLVLKGQKSILKNSLISK